MYMYTCITAEVSPFEETYNDIIDSVDTSERIEATGRNEANSVVSTATTSHSATAATCTTTLPLEGNPENEDTQQEPLELKPAPPVVEPPPPQMGERPDACTQLQRPKSGEQEPKLETGTQQGAPYSTSVSSPTAQEPFSYHFGKERPSLFPIRISFHLTRLTLSMRHLATPRKKEGDNFEAHRGRDFDGRFYRLFEKASTSTCISFLEEAFAAMAAPTKKEGDDFEAQRGRDFRRNDGGFYSLFEKASTSISLLGGACAASSPPKRMRVSTASMLSCSADGQSIFVGGGGGGGGIRENKSTSPQKKGREERGADKENFSQENEDSTEGNGSGGEAGAITDQGSKEGMGDETLPFSGSKADGFDGDISPIVDDKPPTEPPGLPPDIGSFFGLAPDDDHHLVMPDPHPVNCTPEYEEGFVQAGNSNLVGLGVPDSLKHVVTGFDSSFHTEASYEEFEPVSVSELYQLTYFE